MNQNQNPVKSNSGKLRAVLAGAALSSGLLMPSSAWACCDDFWSCAGAVMTGGLSCVIQEAQRESQRLLNEARGARDRARARYDEAVNGTNAKVQEAKTQAETKSQESMQAVNQANEKVQAALRLPRFQMATLRTSLNAQELAVGNNALAGRSVLGNLAGGGQAAGASSGSAVVVTPPPQPSGGSVVVTAPAGQGNAAPDAARVAPIGSIAALVPRPPSPEEVRQALEDAARTLDNLRRKAAERDLPVVSRTVAKMNDDIGRAIGNLNGLAHRLVFGPLEDVLSILGRADPTGLTTLLAAAITSLDGAMYALETELFRAMESLDDTLVGLLGEVEGAVSEIVADSDLARQIEAAVNNLNSTPTQAEVVALKRLLPPEPARPLTFAAIRGLSGGAASSAFRITPTRGKALAANLKTDVSGFAQQLRDPLLKAKFQPKSDLTPYLGGTRRFADGQFTGLDAAAKQRKIQELLSEARRRHPNADNAKLQEFERVLAQAAGAAPVPGNLANVPALPAIPAVPALPGNAINVPPPVGGGVGAGVGAAALPAAAGLPPLPGAVGAKPVVPLGANVPPLGGTQGILVGNQPAAAAPPVVGGTQGILIGNQPAAARVPPLGATGAAGAAPSTTGIMMPPGNLPPLQAPAVIATPAPAAASPAVLAPIRPASAPLVVQPLRPITLPGPIK
jgi:hypothetical protein